jgi:hypothetical protein
MIANYRVIALLSQVLKGQLQWVKARPDYEPLFSILDGLRQDAGRRFWIERLDAQENNCDIEEDTGQVSIGVEIAFPVSHNVLTIAEEYAR